MLLPNAFGQYMKQIFHGKVLFPGEQSSAGKSEALPIGYNTRIAASISEAMKHGWLTDDQVNEIQHGERP